MLTLPTASSGDFIFFLSWLSRTFPPNLGQVEFTVVTGELERNKRACLSLTRASLSPSPTLGHMQQQVRPSLRCTLRRTRLICWKTWIRFYKVQVWARTTRGPSPSRCRRIRDGLRRLVSRIKTLSRSFSRSVWYALVCNEATVWPAAAYALPFKQDSGLRWQGGSLKRDYFMVLFYSITSNNSSYAVQEDWEGSVSTSSPSNISCSYLA